MASDPVAEALLRMVEGRADIDGRFINIRRLGSSGGGGHFSLVFSATDTTTGDLVAVKVFRPDRNDPYRLACFEREEEILRSLAGQRDIVGWVAQRSQFVEMMTNPQQIAFPLTFQYYAVELARESVGDVLASGRWGAEQYLLAFRDMCRAIQRIHRQIIVHRDLKPDNFLVMRDGTVKLSDFGAARRLNAAAPALAVHYQGPPGDMRYAAPELFACLQNEDPKFAYGADIFALGATLFEFFAGTKLSSHIYDQRFQQDLFQIMLAMQSGKHIEIYNQLVPTIVAARPLPSVAAFGAPVPACIRDRVDDLYQSMAALDYRARLRDFRRIFRQINICLVILRNEEQYRRWQESKKQRRRAAAAARGGS